MEEVKEITLELVHTGGPFGDCTDNYVIITNASTLGEFITAILGKDKFQTFCIRTESGDYVCVAYAKEGKIARKTSSYESLLSMKLKTVKSNGGWGAMTYDFWVEGNPPVQDRKEFEMVYFGYKIKKNSV